MFLLTSFCPCIYNACAEFISAYHAVPPSVGFSLLRQCDFLPV